MQRQRRENEKTDHVERSHGSLRLSTEATLLAPFEVQENWQVLYSQLKKELLQNLPTLESLKDKRSIVNFALFILSNPEENWPKSIPTFLLQQVLESPLEDIRWHCAEALNIYLQHNQNEIPHIIQFAREHQSDSLQPKNLSTELIEVLHSFSLENSFPEGMALQTAIEIRNEELSLKEMMEKLIESEEYAIDLLEIASKTYKGALWSHPEAQILLKKYLPKTDLDSLNSQTHPNWKTRALLVDQMRFLDQGNTTQTLEELYTAITTDPHEEVRARARNSLNELISQQESNIENWIERLISDFTNRSENELRFLAGILPKLMEKLSEEKRIAIEKTLREIALSHPVAYNRKTALKTLFKSSFSDERPGETQEQTLYFGIGSLQDIDTSVQEEALQCLTKRCQERTLSTAEAKKILSNLDVQKYDWFQKRLLLELSRQVEKTNLTQESPNTLPSVLIFPGTYDPIHTGHVEASTQATELTGREVWFVPNVALRRKQPLSIEQRYTLIQKAIAHTPNVYVVPLHLLQKNGEWIDDKLEKREQLKSYAQDVGFLRGSDVLERGSYTDQDSAMRNIFHVIAYRKGTIDLDPHIILEEQNLTQWPVIEQEKSSSSSLIRPRIQAGEWKTLHDTLPPLVIQQLQHDNWYAKA